ncbi:TIGR03943 family protein, partial [Arthrospira sp. O9.13F]
PVMLPDNNRGAYPQDSWLQVEGEMTTEVLNNQRRLTIKADRLTPIPEPRNPYEY